MTFSDNGDNDEISTFLVEHTLPGVYTRGQLQ
jgi:hypothetical protein